MILASPAITQSVQPPTFHYDANRTEEVRQISESHFPFELSEKGYVALGVSIAPTFAHPERNDFFQEIIEIQEECADTNWDGDGALPISQKSINYARKFFKALPLSIDVPEPVPEPNGELALVWRQNGYHIAVSISEKAELAFGGRVKSGSIAGTEKFDGTIPEHLKNIIMKASGV